jgi:hypothetical protein
LLIWQFHDGKASIRTEDKWSAAARGEWSGGSASAAGKGGRKGGRLALGEENGDDEESLSE